jgi:DNA-binding transcriptional ArsR family regulator
MVVDHRNDDHDDDDREPGDREAGDHSTDELLRALADGTRRDIVARALVGEHSVSSLACSYPMSFAAVQKHVAVLHRAGLVHKRSHGREVLVRAEPEALATARLALDRLEAVWRDRVERMDALLAGHDQGEPHDPIAAQDHRGRQAAPKQGKGPR